MSNSLRRFAVYAHRTVGMSWTTRVGPAGRATRRRRADPGRCQCISRFTSASAPIVYGAVRTATRQILGRDAVPALHLRRLAGTGSTTSGGASGGGAEWWRCLPHPPSTATRMHAATIVLILFRAPVPAPSGDWPGHATRFFVLSRTPSVSMLPGLSRCREAHPVRRRSCCDPTLAVCPGCAVRCRCGTARARHTARPEVSQAAQNRGMALRAFASEGRRVCRFNTPSTGPSRH